jgi:hypothetical protein
MVRFAWKSTSRGAEEFPLDNWAFGLRKRRRFVSEEVGQAYRQKCINTGL